MLAGCLKCTEACSTKLQEGDPFEYKNFVATITRVPEYARIMQTLGAFWIGLLFKFSLIWLTLEEYQLDYHLCDYEEESWPRQLMVIQGYIALGEDIVGAYNFTDLHRGYNKRS